MTNGSPLVGAAHSAARAENRAGANFPRGRTDGAIPPLAPRPCRPSLSAGGVRPTIPGPHLCDILHRQQKLNIRHILHILHICVYSRLASGPAGNAAASRISGQSLHPLPQPAQSPADCRGGAGAGGAPRSRFRVARSAPTAAPGTASPPHARTCPAPASFSRHPAPAPAPAPSLLTLSGPPLHDPPVRTPQVPPWTPRPSGHCHVTQSKLRRGPQAQRAAPSRAAGQAAHSSGGPGGRDQCVPSSLPPADISSGYGPIRDSDTGRYVTRIRADTWLGYGPIRDSVGDLRRICRPASVSGIPCSALYASPLRTRPARPARPVEVSTGPDERGPHQSMSSEKTRKSRSGPIRRIASR